ncbi:signal transduction histidine kinase [Streptomyces griseochromogenes]|uniref:histidine kinase n=1 Tax=Streptomyces griseochromogenes TaxID=68214 RepID=A0A1B1ANR6_9ACTN|nr:histidine kinase [Streptomyces griseochromogenes]ANP48212.1 two-component sensor histidine kinase [Streptomyces griseochromogenes]MBP2050865.1 signal transduction histidine kinase [Streptomyces griseochromogenes]
MSPRRPPALVLDLALAGFALADVWFHVDVEDQPAAAFALLGALALMLRRRLPLTTFVLTLLTALVTDAVVAPMAALYTLSSLNRHRLLLAGCALIYAIIDFLPWPWSSLDATELSQTNNLFHLTYTLATAAAPVFLGQLVQARRELSLRLADIFEAREHERLLTAQSVLAKERAQLAREMHDVVSHQVSLIAVQAGALQVGSRDAETRQAAATIRRLSVQTLEELRHMVSVLRASGSRPTELTPQPSLADLEHLVEASGIEAKLETDLPEELPPTVQRAVYRTVQEALTNVRKHAPGATATVRIDHRNGGLYATVTNTAPTRRAVALPSAHHGLAGLAQRAELLGGSVTSGPTAQGGYELCLELPVERNR